MAVLQERRPMVAGNWKMNTTDAEAGDLARETVRALGDIAGTDVDVVLCPPFVSLTTVYETIAGSPLLLGAQTLNAAPKGAYTGEVSWTMLRGLCTHVIVGHSERRTYYHETDEDVNKKTLAALDAGLTPIACVGERLEQREAGQAHAYVAGQVRALLDGVAPGAIREVCIAYEPLWAIGTGRSADGPVAREVAALIRGVARELCGEGAEGMRVLYGGSVTAANAAEFAAQPDIDGALVGGASLDAAAFAAITRAFV